MLDKTRAYDINLQQILDNSPDGIFTISPELEIQYVNPAFCRILGYQAGELIGTPITDYLGDLNIQKVCDRELQKHGYCYDQETIFKRKDGSMVHISKNVHAILDEEGNFSKILVSIRDLSQLHQLNKDLEESKKLLQQKNQELETIIEDLRNTQKQLVESEKLASLGGLVAGVAHEINTPLGISITSSSLMHEQLQDLRQKFKADSMKKSELEAFFEQAEASCHILNNNLKRASELVRSFKQVAVDQTADDYRTINVCAYLDEMLLSLGPSFKKSQITVDVECDPLIEVETHPGAIYQIVSNLLLNSMTHAYDPDEKGGITIKVSSDDSHIQLDYADDGKGIETENLQHIFTPFFTTRRGKGGSGLGLSIVYNLVTGTLKGNIQASSEPGQGARFHISIPVNNRD